MIAMTQNPYQPPTQLDPARGMWRPLWRRVCLGSVCATGVFAVTNNVFRAYAQGFLNSHWFIIVDGLLALCELVSWTMIGLAGIGWIISRRPVSSRDSE